VRALDHLSKAQEKAWEVKHDTLFNPKVVATQWLQLHLDGNREFPGQFVVCFTLCR
jgi:hypothetical protein